MIKAVAPDIFPLLHTERLALIPIRQHHLPDLFALFSNEEVTRFYNLVPLKAPADAQKILDHFQSRYATKSGIRWGISLGADRIIGTLGFNNFTANHRSNIGYDLLPQYWNKGFMTEALRAIIAFGFEQLGVNRIEAEVMPGNLSSEKVLEKLGFVKEGLLRDWMLFDGKHFDMHMFALLKDVHKKATGSFTTA
jgi:[ribosomal protein S5]-alanine N-acetyltransferase